MVNNDPRYPYTHAYDYLRLVAGYNSEGTKLSRSDCSQLISVIEEVLELDKKFICEKLADKFLKDREEIGYKAVNEFTRVFNRG